MFSKALTGGLAGLVLICVSSPVLAEPKIGVASATKNEVRGVRGIEQRDLETGSDIFLNEAVQTGNDSVAHLIFLDNTNLSVGPGSLVQLDKFVYDPARGTREVIVEVGRGAFRFVTGAKGQKNYSLKTHVATLGIRGTTFELVSTDGNVKIKLNDGLIQVRTNVGQIVWLTRPETLLTVYANGTVEGPIRYDAPIIHFARLDRAAVPASTGRVQGSDGAPANDLGSGPGLIDRTFRTRPTSGETATQTEVAPFGSPSRPQRGTDAALISPQPGADAAPISPTR